jgi:hypothetical protein
LRRALQLNSPKMAETVSRRIAYGMTPAALILLVGGAALGQGMATFKTEQAAQQHCPADTVVWLNTTSAVSAAS